MAAKSANCFIDKPMKTSGQQFGEARLELDRSAVSAPLGTLQLAEVGRRKLVCAVLQQPGEEQITRLEQRQILLVVDVAGGQQPGCLEVEQGRGDDQELGRLAEVPLGGPGDVGDELVGDLGQRHLGDVELAPGDQAEQQIERTLEVVQPHPERAVVECRRCRLAADGLGGKRLDRQGVLGRQAHGATRSATR